jgi:hypothetical protein
MICHAPNYWKWLPEILRHEGSQVVMLTIWIKWLRGCISSFSADIPCPRCMGDRGHADQRGPGFCS